MAENKKGEAGTDLLLAQNEALTAEVTRLTEELKTLREAAAQPATAAPAPAALPAAKPFDVDGRVVRFKIQKFNIDGTEYLAHEVAEDENLRVEIAVNYPGLVEDVVA